MNLEDYLKRQKDWFLKVFGPGTRDEGLTKHISKELDEIRKAPGDVEEWVDIIILGFEGALRNAGSVDEVVDCLRMKQNKNLNRTWPDWRKADLNKPVEHLKGEHD